MSTTRVVAHNKTLSRYCRANFATKRVRTHKTTVVSDIHPSIYVDPYMHISGARSQIRSLFFLFSGPICTVYTPHTGLTPKSKPPKHHFRSNYLQELWSTTATYNVDKIDNIASIAENAHVSRHSSPFLPLRAFVRQCTESVSHSRLV